MNATRAVIRSRQWKDHRHLVALMVALLLWALSLPLIDLSRVNDLGLVSVLPLSFYVALLLLAISAWSLLQRSHLPEALLGAHLVALIVILHVTLPLLYVVPRFGWTYKHLGVVDYIVQRGRVDPVIDAYHNWPGFFSLIASTVRLARLPDALELARWTPAAFNFLYLLPLAMIYRSFTPHRRVLWFAAWIFVLGNWVGQDYFSPQAFAYLLYLFVIAACLTWLVPQRTSAEPGTMPPPLLYALLLLSAFAIAASHQLTPFMLLASIAALWIAGVRRLWSVFILILLVTLSWDAGMASTYLSRYSHWYSSFGDLERNLQFNVEQPVEYSRTHTLVIRLTRLTTLGLWAVAAVGIIRELRQKRTNWRIVLLAAAPFPMIALGAYGGEMLLRIYLFSLPFMALLAATVFMPADSQPLRRWESWGSLALMLLLQAGILFSAYGNERTNRILPADVQAAKFLYSSAPPGSAVVTFSVDSFPLKLTGDYAEYWHLPIVDDQLDRNVQLTALDYQALQEEMRNRGIPAGFVVFSATQQVYAETNRILAPGAYESFVRIVRDHPEARLIYRNSATMIYRITPAPSRVPQ